jgi:hypothetical protein
MAKQHMLWSPKIIHISKAKIRFDEGTVSVTFELVPPMTLMCCNCYNWCQWTHCYLTRHGEMVA